MQSEEAPPLEVNVELVRNKGGRPAIITLPVVEKVAKLMAKGMTEEQACVRVGIKHCSLRTAKSRNPEFESAIKTAHAEFLDRALDRIGTGTRGWQGMAWILERRHGEQFRRNTGLEVNALVGPYNAGDVLIREPLSQWSKTDVDQSVGAWRLLRAWSKEQLESLYGMYQEVWGRMEIWTDEQLEWGAEVERKINELGDKEQAEELNEAEQGVEALPVVVG